MFISAISKSFVMKHVSYVKMKQFVSKLPISQFHKTNLRNDIYEIESEKDFRNRVMRNSLPVIVNFHADWCEPCLDIKPLLHEIAKANDEKLHLAEVSVDDNPSLLQIFEVTAVPAILGIYRGSVKNKFIGLVSEKEVRNFVDKLLAEVS